jgi:N-acetylglucosaminyldiphosphoundecaprenol N-acetyl-beta-D-mannosaminyltransferase
MNIMNITNKKIHLLDVNIDNISKQEVINGIVETINTNNKAIISNVNLHALNISYTIPWFQRFLNESQIVFCDGVGVQLAAWLTGQKLGYRFTPPDWIDELCEELSINKWGVFFLGSKQGVAHSAADQLHESHPELEISDHHGYFEKSGPENEKVITMINQSKARILFVGMGMPLQEKWIEENFDKLTEVQVILPVGALFDYISQTTPRGPKFLTHHGFEWLTRLIIEPSRLWSRYLIGIPQVLFRIIRHHYFHHSDSSK